MAFPIFLDPYELEPILSGVIPANKQKRPNWLQKFFASEQVTDRERVNFDVQFRVRNVMGQFVEPRADVTPIQLPDFGTQEFRFAYAKEGLNSPDYEEINARQLGQAFGQVDPVTNELLNIQAKLAFAEERFENLHELVSSWILLYGAYTARSEKHHTVNYNFNRQVATVEADYVVGMGGGGLTPSINLTSSAVVAPWDGSITIMPVITWTGGGTPNAWTKANIDAEAASAGSGADPIADLTRMWETAKFREGTEAVVMSADAYNMFNYALNKLYPDASNVLINVLLRGERDILPRIKDVQGLTYKRSYALGSAEGAGNGEIADIYVYDALYHDRTTGLPVSYMPSGFVVLIPPADLGLKIYGRIMNAKADYAPMKRWLNYWMDQKTGKREWEYHMNFVQGHRDINSVVSWKVC